MNPFDDNPILKDPTVLILGAGASQEYGFPLGNELGKLVRERLSPGGYFAALGQQLGFGKDLISELYEALRYGSHPTIDTLLERKPRFRKLGTCAIAKAMIALERQDNLLPMHGWYRDLYEALRFEEILADPPDLAVITLNYDRSLEHFLTKCIQLNCPEPYERSAQARRQRMPILHLHGSLGDYSAVPFSNMGEDVGSLMRAGAAIQIVSDQFVESTVLNEAQGYVKHATNIVFVGLCYEERTLERLFPAHLRKGKRYFGTAFNLNEGKVQFLKDFFADSLSLGKTMENAQQYLRSIGLTRLA